jgi:hypothetical protein
MNEESNASSWWLALVGCVIGAALTALLSSDSHATGSNETGRPIEHFGASFDR